MALSLYKKKRKFNNTPEPGPDKKKGGKELIFVVQRHKASRLHYDFRLEVDGVLKSWAVPKGPSLNPQDKRLAMMVEDHPFDYKDFAGVIPEGNYGAGIVEIWDHGTLTDLDHSDVKTAEKNLRAGIRAGNLKFVLKGRKLKGEFALVRLRNAESNAWLLIKHRDRYAVDEEYTSEAYTTRSSPINAWLKKNGKEVPVLVSARKKAVKKKSAKKVIRKAIRKTIKAATKRARS
jgi:bifunctional non-homologous end joining protein LigD